MCKSVPHCFYYVRISQFSLRYLLTATCQDKINLFRTEEHKTSLTAYRETNVIIMMTMEIGR